MKAEHINYSELKAIYYGLKCFAKNYNSFEILLRVDKNTAISYINKMGSIQFPKFSKLSRKIWQSWEPKNIWLFATYIKSSHNVIADQESRYLSIDTEWELSNGAFQ